MVTLAAPRQTVPLKRVPASYSRIPPECPDLKSPGGARREEWTGQGCLCHPGESTAEIRPERVWARVGGY